MVYRLYPLLVISIQGTFLDCQGQFPASVWGYRGAGPAEWGSDFLGKGSGDIVKK